MIIGIVGSKSFVGNSILNSLKHTYSEIILFDRVQNKNSNENYKYYHFDLAKKYNYNIPKIDILIFCSYDFSKKKWKDIINVNIEGTVNFINKIRKEHQPKIIYISSLSAFKNSKSMYGNAKRLIEEKISYENITIIKCGLIYSKIYGGIYKKLQRIIKISPVLILPRSANNKIFLTNIDDLINLITQIMTIKNEFQVILPAAERKPRRLSDIIKMIAKKENKKLILIFLPNIIFSIILKFLENFNFSFSRDNLISLTNNKEDYNFEEFLSIIKKNV